MTDKEKTITVSLNQFKDKTDWDAVRAMKDSEITKDKENPIITPKTKFDLFLLLK